jgi:hypothetical protein
LSSEIFLALAKPCNLEQTCNNELMVR